VRPRPCLGWAVCRAGWRKSRTKFVSEGAVVAVGEKVSGNDGSEAANYSKMATARSGGVVGSAGPECGK